MSNVNRPKNSTMPRCRQAEKRNQVAEMSTSQRTLSQKTVCRYTSMALWSNAAAINVLFVATLKVTLFLQTLGTGTGCPH